MLQPNRQNANAIFQQMMNNNPQFAQFVRENEGKTAEQIAADYGINPALLNNLLK